MEEMEKSFEEFEEKGFKIIVEEEDGRVMGYEYERYLRVRKEYRWIEED